MPRGGRRQGTPGQAYANRSDLQGVKVASGQAYGVRAQQEAAQRALPMAGATSPGPAPQAPAGPAAAPARPVAGGPLPGAVTPLDAPSQRPDEPVTAGLPVGPGAGMEANPFAGVGSDDDAVMALRAAYAAYPSEAIRVMLERLDFQ